MYVTQACNLRWLACPRAGSKPHTEKLAQVHRLLKEGVTSLNADDKCALGRFLTHHSAFITVGRDVFGLCKLPAAARAVVPVAPALGRDSQGAYLGCFKKGLHVAVKEAERALPVAFWQPAHGMLAPLSRESHGKNAS